jgi:hypothetical protein
MSPHHPLTHSVVAELLAVKGEHTRMPQKALRRASRRALMWPEELSVLLSEGRPLTELDAIGPYVEGVIQGWY